MRWRQQMNSIDARVQALLAGMQRFPWRTTAHTLRERFREDRLGVTAGSLTFTTVISIVPLFTVGLAIFSAFPMFERMEVMLQKWMIQSLMPDSIAKQVSRYLMQFSAKAGKMGWAGALFLLFTALALVLTIDRKLNDIWRVRKLRPLAQRILVYWAVLTLGPLLLGASLSLSSYAMSASRGWVGGLHDGVLLVLDSLEFFLLWLGMAALFRYVPNARVNTGHALAGGLFVALSMEGARKLLAWYLVKVPTYSVVYGAFATVPILMVWIYLAWSIVLAGAVVVAYLPSLTGGVARRADSPGWHFELALDVLVTLQDAKTQADKGLPVAVLAQRLRVDPLQLETPLEVLRSLDWVGQLADEAERQVLLIDPETTLLAPLVQHLLLPERVGTRAFWRGSRLKQLTLGEALAQGGVISVAAV
jgi:membrane protein